MTGDEEALVVAGYMYLQVGGVGQGGLAINDLIALPESATDRYPPGGSLDDC